MKGARARGAGLCTEGECALAWMEVQRRMAQRASEERENIDVGQKEEAKPRRLAARHFIKALREITPSASEAMGTLTELRKWNEEFGENGRAKKRRWGSSFGFMPEPPSSQQQQQSQQPRI